MLIFFVFLLNGPGFFSFWINAIPIEGKLPVVKEIICIRN